MTPGKPTPTTPIVEKTLHAFDNLNGSQPGFRPAHAKGILLAGKFVPSAGARSLSRAPHLNRESTPVTVRFSDFAGIPTIPDNHPEASPRGMAIRFNLAEHVHTDIIAHSVDGFPAHTADEFVEFLEAIYASAASASHPSPVEQFLGSHPAALAFVQAPKPMPASFTKAAFFAVSAYKFSNSEGVSRFGRYQLHPDGIGEYLDASAEAKAAPNFLFDEIKERLAKGPAKMRIAVQVAADGDIVNDATIHWPADRPVIELGVLELSSVIPNDADEQRHIIFDPIPRVDGIEPSDDPLLNVRADVYLASGRRRRKQV